MVEQELTIEVADLNRFQICCGNPDCPVPEVAYETKSLSTTFGGKCPTCGTGYPKRLITAVQHYIRFLDNAAGASKTSKAQISLQIRLFKI